MSEISITKDDPPVMQYCDFDSCLERGSVVVALDVGAGFDAYFCPRHLEQLGDKIQEFLQAHRGE